MDMANIITINRLRFSGLMVVVLFGIMTVMGPGGGDGEVEVVEFAMSLGNFSPNPIIVEADQRNNPIEFSLDFGAAEYGVSGMVLEITDFYDLDKDGDIETRQKITLNFEDMENMTSGTIHGAFTLSTSMKPGTYAIRYYVKDTTNDHSNVDFVDITIY